MRSWSPVHVACVETNRAFSTSLPRRCGEPCKRLVRDPAGLAAPAPVNQTAREPSGDGCQSS